ncbi:MAG: TlyA family RNA methyltransferase [Candidatus Altimarinota bacterium]
MRLDLYISQKLGVSRNRAQFFIKQEKIIINGKIISKVAYEVTQEDNIISNIEEINYVSRSALKLKGFLEQQNIDVQNAVCVDVGASTGGFTQILIEKGAKKIYAIDVGTSQLHETLQGNNKIVSIENTDIRKFDKNNIQEEIDYIVCDVSFISLSLIIDSILDLMNNHTKTILLFKPQFEVGSEYLTKLGVPKNNEIIQKKLQNFFLILEKKSVKVNLVCESSLFGENGNREIFIFIGKLC